MNWLVENELFEILPEKMAKKISKMQYRKCSGYINGLNCQVNIFILQKYLLLNSM